MSVKSTAMPLIVLLLLCLIQQVILAEKEASTDDIAPEPPPFVLIENEMIDEEVEAEYRGPEFSSLKMYRGSLPRLPGVEDNTWIALHSPVKMYIPIRYTGTSSVDSPDCVQCPKNMILLLRGRQNRAVMPVPTISICSGFARRSGRVHVAVVSGPRPGQHLRVGRYPIELMVWKADGPVHSCNYTVRIRGKRQSNKGPLVTRKPPCPKPEQPRNGLVLCVPQDRHFYPHDSVCQFFCTDHFVIENSSTIVCKSGRWSPQDRPTCIATRCPAPPDLGAHGAWKCDTELSDTLGHRAGTLCRIKCASSYVIRTSWLDRTTLRCHPPSWNITGRIPRCERAYLPKLLHCHDQHAIVGIGNKYRLQPRLLPKATTHDGVPLKVSCSLQGRNLEKGLYRNRCQAKDPEMRTQRKCVYHIRVEESSEPIPHPDDCRNRTVVASTSGGMVTVKPARFLVTVGDHKKTKELHSNCTVAGELGPGDYPVLCQTMDPVTNLVGTCSFWLTVKERTCKKTLVPIRNGDLRCSPREREDGHFAVGTICEVICYAGYSLEGNTSVAVCQSDSRWSARKLEDCAPVEPLKLLEGCEDTTFQEEEPINVTVPKPLFLSQLNKTVLAQCTPTLITSHGMHRVHCIVNEENVNVTCVFNITVIALYRGISTESSKTHSSFTESLTADSASAEYSMPLSLPTKLLHTTNIAPLESSTAESSYTEIVTVNSTSTEDSSFTESFTEDSTFTEDYSLPESSTVHISPTVLFSVDLSSTADLSPTVTSPPTESSTVNSSSAESTTLDSSSPESSTLNFLPTQSFIVGSSSTESPVVRSLSTESPAVNSSSTESSTVVSLFTNSSVTVSAGTEALTSIVPVSFEESPTTSPSMAETGSCEPLQELLHGSVSCPPTLLVGDTCEMTCDPGYNFPGHYSHQAECSSDGTWIFLTLDEAGAQPQCLAQMEGSAVEVWISFEAISPHCDEDLEEEIGRMVEDLCQPYTDCKEVTINCTLDEETDMMYMVVNWTVQADFDPEEIPDDDEEIPEAETRLETVLEKSRHMIASGDAPPLQLHRDSFRRGLITLVCPDGFMPDMLMANCVQCATESGSKCLQ